MPALHPLSDALLTELSELLATRAGWHFPPDRWPELERRIHAVARDFDFTDPAACIRWLATSALTSQQAEVLTEHFTVGETYFFRETQALDVFADRILPALIKARQHTTRSLRIWSAACCTGEEPYSLAILLSTRIPNIQDWQVTIVGTDINPRFLRKATAGEYSAWSFRATPPHLRERYFRRTEDGRFALLPEIRRMVHFTQLNLVTDPYPSFLNNTNDMDVIFCRNVFIYFAPDSIASSVAHFHQALVEGGWLIVSPSETAYLPSSLFEPHSFPGTIVHRKRSAFSQPPLHSTPEIPPRAPYSSSASVPVLAPPVASVSSLTKTQDRPPRVPAMASVRPSSQESPAQLLASNEVTERTFREEAEKLYKEGRYEELCHKLQHSLWHSLPPTSPVLPRMVTLLVRSYANVGAWDKAVDCCQKAIDLNPLNARLHYLLATLCAEHGREDAAGLSLKRALYLDPDFAIAHFALAHLARRQHRPQDTHRHLRNAHHALRDSRPDDLVPEAEGLTVKRIRELITNMLASK